MKELFLLLLLPALAFGQVSQSEMNRDVFGNPFNSANQNYIRMLNASGDGVAADNYFIYPDWTSMQAVSLDGGFIEVDSANYFIPEGKIIFITGGEMYNVFPDKVKRVTIEMDQYIALRDHEKFGSTLQFYNVLADGKFKLLKKYTSEKIERTSNPMGISDGGKIEVIKKSHLYYQPEIGEILLLPKKKKDIIELFKRKKSRMVTYAKENDSSHRSEKDIISLFNHYNFLISEDN